MSLLRALLSLLLVVALAAAAARPKESEGVAPVEAPCNASVLSAPFTGPLVVTYVASYGCENGWAYLWATIGSGPTAVGVTEVLHYDQSHQQWRIAIRHRVCSAAIMPRYVYQRGCFSN